MYVPPLFRNDDRGEVIAFLRQRGFGLAVATGSDEPVGTHVPFLVDDDGQDALRLRFHVARGNPLWQQVAPDQRMLVCVSGADAYISPDWYDSAGQVPTWNYVAVHCVGAARVLTEAELLRLLADLSGEHERRLAPKPPWTLDKLSPAALARLLTTIVGIEVAVDRIDTQWKLSQNKKETDGRGAVAGLEARDDQGSLEVARLMRARGIGG